MRYHPRIGYTYMPDAKLRVQGANGGYLVRTNAAGFRSDREFVPARKSGTFRVMLFGDSQTAGDGTINALRYSDLLEKAVPDLEINNYGLSGTGTDQQLLTYRENSAIEHDLVVIGIYVENVRRLLSRIVRSRDVSGEELFRAKPYFTMDPEGMVLRNVPVPGHRLSCVRPAARLTQARYRRAQRALVRRVRPSLGARSRGARAAAGTSGSRVHEAARTDGIAFARSDRDPAHPGPPAAAARQGRCVRARNSASRASASVTRGCSGSSACLSTSAPATSNRSASE